MIIRRVQLACVAGLSLACVSWMLSCGLLASAADKDEAKGPAGRTELSRFQAFVGAWRGVGQPKRGSTDGAWSERLEWAWKFDQGSARLRFAAPQGKYWREATLAPSDKSGEFRLTLAPAKSTGNSNSEEFLRYAGRAADDGSLVLDAVDAEKLSADQPQRITVRLVAGGDRLIILLERRSALSDRYARLAEIGYTRQGSDFGKGATQIECVVTGGLGTMPVTHEGQTYYVCCAGCRDLFLQKPAEILAEYRERKAKEKADAEKKKEKERAGQGA